MTPPVYQFYRKSKSGTYTVIQLRDHVSKETVNVLDLACYEVKSPLKTPYWGITVGKGSRMFLIPSAVAEMLAAGTVVPFESVVCMPWRLGYEANAAAMRGKRNSRGQLPHE